MQLDLLGCGDSSGDFGDATWDDWLEDTLLACRWLRDRCAAPLWLWGLRAGCLLAAEAARRLDDGPGLLFWQPSPSGRQLLQQFLRFKAAGDLAEGNAKAVMEGLRRQLATGQAVDVVGYRVSAGLAEGLERAQLAPVGGARQLAWIELSSRAETALSPAATRGLEAWRQAGVPVVSRVAAGPAFWQTIDIEEAPDLIDATLAVLDDRQQVAA
jgi:exosortase A-associated hydrolase 2